MSVQRRPTWLDMTRLERGALDAEAAAELRARIERVGVPDDGGVSEAQAFAEQPTAAFLGAVRRRALVLRLRRLAASFVVVTAVAAVLLWWVWSFAGGPVESSATVPRQAPIEIGTGAWSEPVPAPARPQIPADDEVGPEMSPNVESSATGSPEPKRGKSTTPNSPEPADLPQPPIVDAAALTPAVLPEPSPESTGEPEAGVEPDAKADWAPPARVRFGHVQLYASMEDLSAGVPTGGTSVRVIRIGEHGARPRARDRVEYWGLDVQLRGSWDRGKVFAFSVNGEVYVNELAPRPTRYTRYGRLTRVGTRGVYIRRVCFANGGGGQVNCEPEVRLLDFERGTRERVGTLKLRRWLSAAPELEARFEASGDGRIKHETVVRQFLVELLKTNPDVGR